MFADLYNNLIFLPQVNILYLIYKLTGENIGFSIILMAFFINLLLFPFFASSFINGQKLRIFQPAINKIQKDYKDDPFKLRAELTDFYKRHKISSGSIFLVLIIQILIASALWNLTTMVSKGESIQGLYSFIFKDTTTTLKTLAFGFIEIGRASSDYIFIPIINFLLSISYGYYTFKLAPKVAPIKLPESKEEKKLIKSKKKQEKAKEEIILDPEAIQKSMEFYSIWVLPVVFLFINLSLTTGVAIYFTTVSLISLIRQISLSTYYSRHKFELIEKIAQSDPTSKDDNPDNNLYSDVEPGQIDKDKKTELVLPKKQKNKKAKK